MFEDAELGGLYHGSGADFDVFDPDKVGSGHRHNSYGWGFYLTEILDMAKWYSKEIATRVNYELVEDIVHHIREYCRHNKIEDSIGSDLISAIPILADPDYLENSKMVLSKNTYAAIKRNFTKYIAADEWLLKDLIGILDNVYPEIEKKLVKWKNQINYSIKLVKKGDSFSFINFHERLSEEDVIKIINQMEKDALGRFFTNEKDEIKKLNGDRLLDYLGKNVLKTKFKKDVSMFLLEAGFDGIVIPERKFYVIFDPNIIRIVEKTNV